jgi:hypothetical protein
MFHFHYCGNPAHDVVHNTFVLLTLMPEWLPGIMAAKDDLKRRLLKVQHTEEGCSDILCDHTEEG